MNEDDMIREAAALKHRLSGPQYLTPLQMLGRDVRKELDQMDNRIESANANAEWALRTAVWVAGGANGEPPERKAPEWEKRESRERMRQLIDLMQPTKPE